MIKIDDELKDMMICAFRYALGRKTYVTVEVCNYIMQYPELVDERVKTVMLRDLESLDDYYYFKTDIDRPVFEKLKSWLEELEIGE